MDAIKELIENIIRACGVSGGAVPVVRHVALAVVAVLLAWLAEALCRRLLVPLVRRITSRTAVTWDDVLFSDKVLLAFCRVVPAVVIWQLLPLVFYQFPTAREVISRLTAIYITIATAHLFVVFINTFKNLDTGHGTNTRQYMQTFCGVLKILLLFVAAIVVVAIAINKSPMTLLAGLGATSAILMLVFKDTIEGLVAGVRLTSNDMLHVGDWITVPAAGADGTVEEMTLTTVKIRNFDNTIITVSPTALVSGSFKNWIGMQQSPGRRVSRKLLFDVRSIHFTDEGPTNMALFRQAVEDYLQENELLNHDMLMMVRQLEVTQYGIPLELYFFLKEKAWKEYEHQLAAIVEHVAAMAPAYGLQLAAPVRTE